MVIGKRFSKVSREPYFWELPNSELIDVLGESHEPHIILDVGSECGMRSRFLNEAGHTVIAIDLNLERFLYENYEGIIGLAGDAQHLPFKENVFDLVVSIELLEHLRYPDKFLKDSFTTLKDQGTLFCTVPCLNIPFFREQFVWVYRKLIGYTEDPVFGHKHVFSDKKVQGLIEEDFVMTKIKYQHVLLFLSRAFGVNRQDVYVITKRFPLFLSRMLAEGVMLVCRKKNDDEG